MQNSKLSDHINYFIRLVYFLKEILMKILFPKTKKIYVIIIVLLLSNKTTCQSVKDTPNMKSLPSDETSDFVKKIKAKIYLDDKILDLYTGKYQSDPSIGIITIERRGDGLVMK